MKAPNDTHYPQFCITANTIICKCLCVRLKSTLQIQNKIFKVYQVCSFHFYQLKLKKKTNSQVSRHPFFPILNTGNVSANRRQSKRVSFSQFQPAVSDSPPPALALIGGRNAAQPHAGLADLLVKSNQLSVQGFQSEGFT